MADARQRRRVGRDDVREAGDESSEASVYWFDDTGHGSVRVPATWRLLYKDGAGWKPVEAVDGYGVARDCFNRVSFKPVTTGALRLEVTMQPTFSAGLQEWTVK